MYIGSSTQRSHNSTQLRRNKKELEKIDYEMIGTEGRKAAKEKSNFLSIVDFFYEGKMTDNTLKWVSKETRNQKRTGSQERERTPLSTNQK